MRPYSIKVQHAPTVQLIQNHLKYIFGSFCTAIKCSFNHRLKLTSSDWGQPVWQWLLLSHGQNKKLSPTTPPPPSLKHHPEAFRSANNEASAGTHPAKYSYILHVCVGLYKMCLAWTPTESKTHQIPLILEAIMFTGAEATNRIYSLAKK